MYNKYFISKIFAQRAFCLSGWAIIKSWIIVLLEKYKNILSNSKKLNINTKKTEHKITFEYIKHNENNNKLNVILILQYE